MSNPTSSKDLQKPFVTCLTCLEKHVNNDEYMFPTTEGCLDTRTCMLAHYAKQRTINVSLVHRVSHVIYSTNPTGNSPEMIQKLQTMLQNITIEPNNAEKTHIISLLIAMISSNYAKYLFEDQIHPCDTTNSNVLTPEERATRISTISMAVYLDLIDQLHWIPHWVTHHFAFIMNMFGTAHHTQKLLDHPEKPHYRIYLDATLPVADPTMQAKVKLIRRMLSATMYYVLENQIDKTRGISELIKLQTDHIIAPVKQQ